MKAIALLTLIAVTASAQTTLDGAHAVAYGGNIGWIKTSTSTSEGIRTGEYVCSGSIYAANVGWISLGDGTADNGIRYSNTSATDYGVNTMPAVFDGGLTVAPLRGYAYGANIGWVNFEPSGNPRIDLKTGRFLGYAYSANTGWLNLGDATHYTRTKALAPAPDTDGDGIADAWELVRTGTAASLTKLTATGDFDGDGMSDLAEYLAETNPFDPNERLKITTFSRTLTSPVDQDITLKWTANPARCYRIETRDNLTSGTWLDVGFTFSGGGPIISTILPEVATTQRFYRVLATKPLAQ